MLEELNAQSARRGPMPNDVMQKPRVAKESNVIEITEAEIVPPAGHENEHPHDRDRGINLPRIRPVTIQPPNVRIL